MPVLVPGITVIVHPIDTQAHPAIQPGWRWAVMVGAGCPPGDLSRCANAGWAGTEHQAWVDGETVGAAAVKALRMHGIAASYARLPLDHDPIPAGGDRLGAPV
jgi:hypothetical protein